MDVSRPELQELDNEEKFVGELATKLSTQGQFLYIQGEPKVSSL